MSAENSGKPLGGRGSAPNPAAEFTALCQTLQLVGRGLLAPPNDSTPLSAFGPSISPQ